MHCCFFQDLLKILRKKPEKKKAVAERDLPANANRRAGTMFALACLKRTMGEEVRSGVFLCETCFRPCSLFFPGGLFCEADLIDVHCVLLIELYYYYTTHYTSQTAPCHAWKAFSPRGYLMRENMLPVPRWPFLECESLAVCVCILFLLFGGPAIYFSCLTLVRGWGMQ